MYKVNLLVRARRFVPGTTRNENFEFEYKTHDEFKTRRGLFVTCCKEFGRCSGKIINRDNTSVGWTFEGKEKDDIGDIHWWETEVVILSGDIGKRGELVFQK